MEKQTRWEITNYLPDYWAYSAAAEREREAEKPRRGSPGMARYYHQCEPTQFRTTPPRPRITLASRAFEAKVTPYVEPKPEPEPVKAIPAEKTSSELWAEIFAMAEKKHKISTCEHEFNPPADYEWRDQKREWPRLLVNDIVKAVAAFYNVSVADILSIRRTAVIVRPRQEAMFLAKMLTGRSFPEVGRFIGGRDHTTVLHAVKKLSAEHGHEHTDPELYEIALARWREITGCALVDEG